MPLQQFSFTKPQSNIAPEQRQFERQRQIAQALQLQAMQPDKQQMAGGYVVQQGILSPVAKIAQALAGQKMMSGADEGEREYQRRTSQDRSRQIAQAMQAAQGREAQPAVPAPSEEAGGVGPARPEMPAMGPDPQRAFASLAASADPMLQQMGAAGMLKGLDRQPKWERTELPNPDGTKRVGFVNVNSPNPVETFVSGGVAPVRQELVNTGGSVTPVNPYQTQSPVPTTPRPQQDELERVLIASGIDLKSPEAQSLFRSRASKLATHQPPSNVTAVATAGPKAFETEIGKQDAEKIAEWRKNAEAGQAMLGTVTNLRAAIKQGVYSGGGANLKTEAANLINGLTGVTPQNLPGSQLFTAEASKLVLDSIKLLGANPSNADRDFLQKTIPQLATSPQARDELINFLEKKASAQIELFQRADQYGRANRGLGGFPVTPSGKTLRFDARGNQVQ